MRIKFICLNLWLGGKLFDNVLEFIRKENPDILAMQEVYNAKNEKLEKRFRSLEILRAALALPHYYFSPACYWMLPKEKLDTGNVIFSRFPIIESKTIFFDVPYGEKPYFEDPDGDYTLTPRNMQHATIEIGKTRLNVFNTQGIWGVDGGDNKRRLKMSEDIVREIKGKKNVILTGDFNVLPHTKTTNNIEKYLVNIFKGELKSTFNMHQKSNPVFANLVVDYIFVSKNLQIIDHYCPQMDVSDHLPLVCAFEI